MSGTPGAEQLPDGLWDAVLAYESALRDDDLAALDAAFEPGGIRSDAAGVLVGEQISRFRGARGGIPLRTLVRVEAREAAPDAWMVVSVSRFAAGGEGVQTQLWRRSENGWRIAVAHVSGKQPAIDRTVWRTVGDPLLAGATDGALHGRTIAVKDVYAVAGHRIGAGIPAWEDEADVEPHSAEALQALLDAGASVRGIARTDELAYSIAGQNPHSGTPRNARVPGALPGGSTSGPATAVALAQADIGLGTDTAGSIRVPASYQGLWGLRSTHGAVSRVGVLPLAERFDTVGWLTRDAATLRAAAVATLGEAAISTGDIIHAPVTLDALDVDARTGVWAAIAPHSSGEVALPDLEALFDAFRVAQQGQVWANHGAWISAHPGALGEVVGGRFALASQLSAADARAALARVDEFAARIDDALGDHVLILPTVPTAAPAANADGPAIEHIRKTTLQLTAIAGITGRPALSVPAIELPEGPLGVCLVGPRGSDVALIDLAERLGLGTPNPAQ